MCQTKHNKMKKVIITLSFASLLLMACGGEKASETDEVAEEVTATVDSAAVEMHQATEEIEQASDELDEVLNDI